MLFFIFTFIFFAQENKQFKVEINYQMQFFLDKKPSDEALSKTYMNNFSVLSLKYTLSSRLNNFQNIPDEVKDLLIYEFTNINTYDELIKYINNIEVNYSNLKKYFNSEYNYRFDISNLKKELIEELNYNSYEYNKAMWDIQFVSDMNSLKNIIRNFKNSRPSEFKKLEFISKIIRLIPTNSIMYEDIGKLRLASGKNNLNLVKLLRTVHTQNEDDSHVCFAKGAVASFLATELEIQGKILNTVYAVPSSFHSDSRIITKDGVYSINGSQLSFNKRQLFTSFDSMNETGLYVRLNKLSFDENGNIHNKGIGSMPTNIGNLINEKSNNKEFINPEHKINYNENSIHIFLKNKVFEIFQGKMPNEHKVTGVVYKNTKGLTAMLFNRQHENTFNYYNENLERNFENTNKLNQTGVTLNYKKYLNFWYFKTNNSKTKFGTNLSSSAMISTDKQINTRKTTVSSNNQDLGQTISSGFTPDINISFIPEATYSRKNLEINLLGELCYSGKYMDTNSSSLIAVNYIQLNGDYKIERNKLIFNLNPEFGIFLPLNEKYLQVNSSCDFTIEQRKDIEIGLNLSLFNNLSYNKSNINTELNLSCDVGSNNMEVYFGTNTGKIDNNSEKFYVGCKIQLSKNK